jgi:hypothetical protein
MKIRCGSHQQNRSIVRPGLSLMATKVALTAEEFRENSQRSIDLFNTKKLSTDSTHVLKSAYCNSVHFCRSNLHGACGGKGTDIKDADYIESRSNLHGACGGKAKSYSLFFSFRSSNLHGACGGKGRMCTSAAARGTLQSARGVWRQRQDCGCHKMAYCRCNLHGTCRETERHHPSPEKNPRKFMQTYCIFIHLAV